MNKYQSKDKWQIDKAKVLEELKNEIAQTVINELKHLSKVKGFEYKKNYRDQAIVYWAKNLTEKDITNRINISLYKKMFDTHITDIQRIKARNSIKEALANDKISEEVKLQLEQSLLLDELKEKIEIQQIIIEKNEKTIKNIKEKSFGKTIGIQLNTICSQYINNIDNANKEIDKINIEITKISQEQGEKILKSYTKKLESIQSDINTYNEETLNKIIDELNKKLEEIKTILAAKKLEYSKVKEVYDELEENYSDHKITKVVYDKEIEKAKDKVNKINDELDELDKKYQSIHKGLQNTRKKIQNIKDNNLTDLDELLNQEIYYEDIVEKLEEAYNDINDKLAKDIEYFEEEINNALHDTLARKIRRQKETVIKLNKTSSIKPKIVNISSEYEKIKNKNSEKYNDYKAQLLQLMLLGVDKVEVKTERLIKANEALEKSFEEVIEYYKKQYQITIDKRNTLEPFVKGLYEQIKKNTPKTPDEIHRKHHQKDGLKHLVDTIKYAKIDDDTYIIWSDSPYAYRINESYNYNHPNGGRAGYMTDVAIEYSSISGNPYDIYLGVAFCNNFIAISLLVKNNDIDINKHISAGGIGFNFSDVKLVECGIEDYSELETEYINKIYNNNKNYIPEKIKSEIKSKLRLAFLSKISREKELKEKIDKFYSSKNRTKKRKEEVEALKKERTKLKMELDPIFNIISKTHTERAYTDEEEKIIVKAIRNGKELLKKLENYYSLTEEDQINLLINPITNIKTNKEQDVIEEITSKEETSIEQIHYETEIIKENNGPAITEEPMIKENRPTRYLNKEAVRKAAQAAAEQAQNKARDMMFAGDEHSATQYHFYKKELNNGLTSRYAEYRDNIIKAIDEIQESDDINVYNILRMANEDQLVNMILNAEKNKGYMRDEGITNIKWRIIQELNFE